MIIKKKRDETLKDIEVTVEYPREDKEAERLFSVLSSLDKQVPCFGPYRQQLANASAIYYIESVDKKTFVYLEKDVLRTELKLYQLQEKLGPVGFVQISKSCLLNLQKLESIKPLINSRMEAQLSNGEKILVTRKYLGEIRRVLQEGWK